MSPKERVGFLGNLTALLDAGILRGEDYVKLLTRFADDPSPDVISALTENMTVVRRVFVTRELADPYAVYVRRTLAPALGRFGLTRRSGEVAGISTARSLLIGALGDDGKDTGVLAYADSLAKRHIAEPGSVDPSVIEAALALSALRGDEALFTDYKKRFETAKIPAERSRYLKALGNFRDPKLVDAAIRYSLEGPLRPQEVFVIPTELASSIEYEDVPFKWMTGNYATIQSKVPPMFMVFMPTFVGGCYLDRLEKAKAFFAEPSHSVPGTEKELAKVSDAVRDCAGLREREGVAVASYLRGLSGSGGDPVSPAAGGAPGRGIR
jgi:hypothetical protein